MVSRVGTPSRFRRGRGWVIVVVILLLLLAVGLARFYTDVLWFREVDLSAVLWRSLQTQFLVGLTVGVLTAAILWLNLWVAARVAPAYRVPRLEVIGGADPLDRYREVIGPYTRLLRLGIAGLVGFVSGIGAAGAWQTYLLWANRVDFGVTDPQFGRDISFYVFELPFLDTLLEWVWFALMASLFLSVAAHFFQGSIRPVPSLSAVAPPALAHLSVLLGLLAVVKAGQYILGTYHLNFSPRGVVTGASYTDVHAQLPALRLLAIISLISAALFLINIWARRVSLPLAAVGIWIFTAVVAGGIWPWWIQNFSVKPQELQRERPFIERNIEATNEAFGLGEVQTTPFLATEQLPPEEVEANRPVLQNVRLWDPEILQRAYGQLQAIRTYYEFADVDIDRYVIDGEMRQVLLAPRELALDNLPEKTWQNEHLRFTHGFGVVASLANEKTSGGQPSFLVKDVPGTVDEVADSLTLDQPRLYFGEAFDAAAYSIVNSRQEELDFATEEGTQDFNYDGEGGIKVGGFFNQIAFAIREGDPNMVLSNLITDDSRILLYRNVRDRIHRAAPFLALDHDPYIAAVDGRLTWIVDAYTTTRWYPYSQRFDAGAIVASEEIGTLDGDISYIRNSVKVLVDAFNGTMEFQIIDDTDPLIQAWAKAFPELFSTEEVPEGIREHFRYPEDMFKIQSQVHLKWHMKDPDDFYANEDQWSIPTTLTNDEAAAAPTYLLTQLPDEDEQEFVLTRPFTPRARNNMIGFLVGRSDPEHYGELVLLQFPRQRLVAGPSQVDNFINQDVEISQNLSLLRQEGSDVEFGSLVILPIEDSIVYIQPLFVTADTQGIPELKKIVIVFGDEAVMGDTFEQALTDTFDLDEPPPVEPGPPGGPQPPTPPGGQAELTELVARAGRVYEQAQQALSNGDFDRYGELIERLGRLLERAQALSTRTR